MRGGGLFWYWEVPIFLKIRLLRAIIPYLNSQLKNNTCSRLLRYYSIFENNMVHTVKYSCKQMMYIYYSNLPFDVLERQKCVNLRKIFASRKVFGFSEFRGEDLTRGEGENSGGLKPPLELCFGTSEIKCSASWSYIMSTFLTLLLSCY